MIGRLALLLLALWSFPAAAYGGTMAREIPLAPDSSSVAIRAYGLGLVPFDGRFARFHGVLRYDPDDHARCRVALQVDVASLAMAQSAMTATVLGPDFLDAGRYPALAYEGACGRDGIAGALTMHGVTRPFGLTLDWRRNAVEGVGRLRRADWGMTARPFLAGRFVRITVTVGLGER
ncbi:MAG TPA: YceI family protein [Acetobacteraceae bacterium]|nr:YceI family protein [Acetobacteraceae bacterium]